MPKLDLRAARQIKGPMGELLALKGPGYAWAKQMPVSAYYGIGPGQIPGDWRIDDPVVSGSIITAVRNDGGAGPLFAMGQRAAQPLPLRSGMLADVSGSRQMLLANAVDMVNVHFMAVVDPRGAPTVNAPILARNARDSSYLEFRQTHLMLRQQGSDATWPEAAMANINYPVGAELGLYEFRWQQGIPPALFYNGALVGYSARGALPHTTYAMQVFAGGSASTPSHGYTGPVGRCISVIVDPGFSPTNLEPAVLAARATLAQQYGITLQ